MESGSCLTRLADYLNANALREVAQLTEITFTGAGIALYLNVAGELEVGDRALGVNSYILTRGAWKQLVLKCAIAMLLTVFHLS